MTKHVTDHEGFDWEDKELEALIGQLRLYSERLTDFTQAQVLRGLGRGVDVQRFSNDSHYKKETILGLAEYVLGWGWWAGWGRGYGYIFYTNLMTQWFNLVSLSDSYTLECCLLGCFVFFFLVPGGPRSPASHKISEFFFCSMLIS